MKGLLLAAGLGSRLRPLTDRIPKPLVPIFGRPCIEYLIETFAELGITDLAINTHHLAVQLHEHLADGSRYGISLHWQHEEALLDGCGTLKSFDWLFGGETVLVANADVVHDLDLRRAIGAHRDSGAALTLVAVPHVGPLRQSLGWDAAGRLHRVRQVGLDVTAPLFLGDFSGFHLVEPEVWREHIPRGERFHLTRELCPALLARDVPVSVHLADGFWATVGDRQEYDRAVTRLLRHRPARYLPPELAERSLLWRAADATVDGAIHPPAYVGPGAVVGRDAELGPYASLEAGAVLRDGEVLRRGIRLAGEG